MIYYPSIWNVPHIKKKKKHLHKSSINIYMSIHRHYKTMKHAYSRCARLCPCQHITFQWAAVWPRCTCALMEHTFTGSGPQPVSMRRLRKAILCSWMSFTSLWEPRTILSYKLFCAWLWFWQAPTRFLSILRCRHKRGCVSQTLCRRGLFSLARKGNLQSAWTSSCWVECLASEPPILPHWLLSRDRRSPTPSRRSNLVINRRQPNSLSVPLISSVGKQLFELLS